MARANHDNKIPTIIGQWRTGAYSIRDLAKKHEVSVGFIAKHTSGIEKDGLAVVNAGIQYSQGLEENDEHFVNAVHEVVVERTKHIQFFSNAAVKNVQEAMATACIGQQDYKFRAETIMKGREAVLGKEAGVAVQVNNNMPQQVIDHDQAKRIAREILSGV